MNVEIQSMIELQGYWDIVLEQRGLRERQLKTIEIWRKNLRDNLGRQEALEKTIKHLKSSIRINETELDEKDEKIKKLEHRRQEIHTEKELLAVTAELKSNIEIKGDIEEKTLTMMEELDAHEKALSECVPEIETMKIQVRNDIEKLEKKIHDIELVIEENESLFNSGTGKLSTMVRTKFVKLVSAKGGKGIGRVTGEICGSCNFKIPPHLALAAARNENIVNCTNCGRFIYI